MISKEIKMMSDIPERSVEVFVDSLMDIIIVCSFQLQSYHLRFYVYYYSWMGDDLMDKSSREMMRYGRKG